MLDKTVAALQADMAGTLAKITKGEGGFKDCDLYPFCGGPDGIYTAHGANPSLVGKSLKEMKDKNGEAVGEELTTTAREGKVAEVAYVWPRPGASTDPVQEVSFVAKVGDQVCAVGYYKQLPQELDRANAGGPGDGAARFVPGRPFRGSVWDIGSQSRTRRQLKTL
jgi:signal transduction histidine kinase